MATKRQTTPKKVEEIRSLIEKIKSTRFISMPEAITSILVYQIEIDALSVNKKDLFIEKLDSKRTELRDYESTIRGVLTYQVGILTELLKTE